MYILVYTNMSSEKEKIIRLSISEAAKLFGVNAQTVRRAIKNGEVVYIVVAGRYKINFESLVKWSQRTTTIKHKSERQGIGRFVEQWKISNKLYSPNPQALETKPKEETPPKKETKATSSKKIEKPLPENTQKMNDSSNSP